MADRGRLVRRAVVWHQVAALLVASAIACVSAALAGHPLTDSPSNRPAGLPSNLIVPEVLRPLVTSMWRQSPTFRRQCARLAEHSEIVVHIELAIRIPDGWARSRMVKRDQRLHAAVQIAWRAPARYVESIAHELEHVLEQMDGTDLPLLARQGVDGVVNLDGTYETARAGSVGRTVAREVAQQRIRADAIGSMTPAALSDAGHLVAFVGRQERSTRGACCQHVYVLDRSTGEIAGQDLDPDGTLRDRDSRAPSLSADGRIIAFETFEWLNGDPPMTRRSVVVRDRPTDVARTLTNTNGDAPDGDSLRPVVSGDGLTLVLTSHATNLTHEPDANGAQPDIYTWRLHDAQHPERSTIARVSVDSRGTQPSAGGSHSPSVNHDGTLVAFVSTARLGPEDTNRVADIYLRDVRRGHTSLVSRGPGAASADAASHSPTLSADGRYVAFVSDAGLRAPHDRNQTSDVYLYDVTTQTTTLVSATSTGTAANAASRAPALSADGRFVVFQSLASNLGSRSVSRCPRPLADTNLLPDVYLFDRTTGCVTRISGSPVSEWWTPSVAPAIDGSGCVVAFSSTQPADEDDVSTDIDLFLFQRSTCSSIQTLPVTVSIVSAR
jgi:Tol biopolymer transport system component